jgi:hypothetical protein
MFLRRRQLGGAPPGEPPAQAKLMIVSRAATPCLAIKRHGPLVRLARQKRGAETEKAAGRHAALGMVSRLGLEPRALALKGRCSTN